MRLIFVFFFFCCCMSQVAIGSESMSSEAVRIAAAVIRERGRAIAEHDTALGRALVELAQSLEDGRIDMTQAHQVLAVMNALPPVPSLQISSVRATTQPAVKVSDITDLLDRELPPVAAAPAKPPEHVSEPTAPPAAEQVESVDPRVESVGKIASVLAMYQGDGEKSTLVMIDAGENLGLKKDQNVAIRRGGKSIVTCRITQVKPTMSVCVLILGTWSEGENAVKEGDQALIIE